MAGANFGPLAQATADMMNGGVDIDGPRSVSRPPRLSQPRLQPLSPALTTFLVIGSVLTTFLVIGSEVVRRARRTRNQGVGATFSSSRRILRARSQQTPVHAAALAGPRTRFRGRAGWTRERRRTWCCITKLIRTLRQVGLALARPRPHNVRGRLHHPLPDGGRGEFGGGIEDSL